MAELTKKLQVKVSGTTTPCKIYSTAAEAGTSYVRAKVDNVDAYIPLVAASDDRASKVHIGSKCIATTGKPPYTEKSWTTAGTYTFTVPAGVTRIRVAVCGGGGGGTTVLTATRYGTTMGGTGGASQFGSLIKATGGNGGAIRGDTDSDTWAAASATGGSGGSPNGRSGTGQMENGQSAAGGIGFAKSFTLTSGSYGGGGSAQDSKSVYESAASGGSGGYNTGYVTVTPTATYSVIVGSGGESNGSYGTRQAGTSGFVLIAFGGDI